MVKGILEEDGDGDGGSDLFRRVRQGLTGQVTFDQSLVRNEVLCHRNI